MLQLLRLDLGIFYFNKKLLKDNPVQSSHSFRGREDHGMAEKSFVSILEGLNINITAVKNDSTEAYVQNYYISHSSSSLDIQYCIRSLLSLHSNDSLEAKPLQQAEAA